MELMTETSPTLSLKFIDKDSGCLRIKFELNLLPRFVKRKLNNLETLGLFCKMHVKRNIAIYDIATHIFYQKAKTKINSADLFLKELPIVSFVSYLSGPEASIDPIVSSVFSFPTKVYIDCEIPWEVWMLLYFSRVQFRDQLLLEEKTYDL